MIKSESNTDTSTRHVQVPIKNMSVAVAADYMGISQRMLRHLITIGEVRHVRIGRRIVLRPADLDEFLSNHAVGGQ